MAVPWQLEIGNFPYQKSSHEQKNKKNEHKQWRITIAVRGMLNMNFHFPTIATIALNWICKAVFRNLPVMITECSYPGNSKLFFFPKRELVYSVYLHLNVSMGISPPPTGSLAMLPCNLTENMAARNDSSPEQRNAHTSYVLDKASFYCGNICIEYQVGL